MKCLQTKLNCDECNLALLSADVKAHPLIEQKDRGGLCRPSESAVTLCMEAEKVIQRLLRKLGGKLPKGPGFVEAICTAVLSNTRDISLFPDLLKHQFETMVEDKKFAVIMLESGSTTLENNIQKCSLVKPYKIL